MGYQNVQYTGIDLSEEMIQCARAKFGEQPEIRLRVGTLDGLTEKFDYVVSSGIFNAKMDVDTSAWEEHILTVIDQQYAACQIGTAFNILTSYVDFTAPHLYYCDPAMILDHCKRHLSRFVCLRHDYPAYEFTTFVFREPRMG
jgi:hypothetical protein